MRLEAIGPNGRSRSLEFLFDTGMVYTVLPSEVWEDLGVQAPREHSFVLMDGTPVDRAVGEAEFKYEGKSAVSPVVLGKPGDMAIVGSATIMGFGLMLHPLTRVLRPLRREGFGVSIKDGRLTR